MDQNSHQTSKTLLRIIPLFVLIIMIVTGLYAYNKIKGNTVTDISNQISPTFQPEPSRKDCTISGCSAEICAEAEMVSVCVFREEYACYKNAKCERQPNGSCGWTQTEELKSCLSSKKGEAAL